MDDVGRDLAAIIKDCKNPNRESLQFARRYADIILNSTREASLSSAFSERNDDGYLHHSRKWLTVEAIHRDQQRHIGSFVATPLLVFVRSSSSNHRTELRSASARVGGCCSIEPIGGGGRHYRPSARRAVSGDPLSFCIHRARGGRRRGRAYCTTYVHRQLSPHAISEARLSVTVDKAASFNRLVCVWRLRINRIVRWERAIYEDTILL
eukprot:scaffold3786_cov204-Alexandrium_tamarense.AAC.32